MIRFIYDHNEIQATASGRSAEITAELGVLINIFYNLIRARSPEMAENFKRGLIESVLSGSPIWDKDDVPDPSVGVKMVRIGNDQKEDLRG